MTNLEQIVTAAADKLQMPYELALKLITFIDLQKIMGQVGGMASSNFGDYLGFLRIPDDWQMQEFFAERWKDNMVRIKVPKDYEKYLHSDAPIFTPSRLEPIYQKKPFYDQGVEKVPVGASRNPFDGGFVRKAPPIEDDYSNFIIEDYLPQNFYMEVPNNEVPKLLREGLPAVNVDNPYVLHIHVEDARLWLNKTLGEKLRRLARKTDLLHYTLIHIEAEKLRIDNDVFFPDNNLHKHSARTGGYFYAAEIPHDAISVAHENIAH